MRIFGVSVKKIPFYDDAHERMLILNSRSWREAVRTASVMAGLLLCILLDTTGQYLADSFFVRQVLHPQDGSVSPYASRPVFDVLLWMLPKRVALPKVFCDICVALLAVVAFATTVLFNPGQRIPFQGLTVLRRFCFIQSIAYIFHILSVPFTLTPSLDPRCAIQTRSHTSFADGALHFLQLTFGLTAPCVNSSYSVTVTLVSNLAFFVMAYSWNGAVKICGLLHATIAILLLALCRHHYTVSIALGLMASAFIFGTYHLLLLVFCQSKIFMGVADKASMGFDLFFLNGFFCRNATRCIEWVDGLDLRQLQPFVADLENETREKSLLSNAKHAIP